MEPTGTNEKNETCVENCENVAEGGGAAILRKWISFSSFPISIFHDNNFMGRRKSKVSVGKADDQRRSPLTNRVPGRGVSRVF